MHFDGVNFKLNAIKLKIIYNQKAVTFIWHVHICMCPLIYCVVWFHLGPQCSVQLEVVFGISQPLQTHWMNQGWHFVRCLANEWMHLPNHFASQMLTVQVCMVNLHINKLPVVGKPHQVCYIIAHSLLTTHPESVSQMGLDFIPALSFCQANSILV